MSFIQTVQKNTMCKHFLVIIITKNISGNLLIRMNQINMPKYHLLQ